MRPLIIYSKFIEEDPNMRLKKNKFFEIALSMATLFSIVGKAQVMTRKENPS